MKYGLYYSILVLVLFSSCLEKNKEQAVKNTGALLDFIEIKGYPKDFKGCGCAFAKSEESYKRKIFIFLEKYGMTDLTKNYKMVNFRGTLLKWNKNNIPEGFTLSIEYDKTESDVESTALKRGTFFVTYSNGDTFEMPVFGNCGC